MCDLVVDIEVETGSFSNNPSDSTPVSCATGRVILAASAHTGSVGSTNAAVPVALSNGALTDSCQVATAGAGTGTVHYYLTTGRVATL